MSHFIANTISISKDFKDFKVKGGDNNVIPRSNSWTSDIELKHLFYNVEGGMIKLNNSSEKLCFINDFTSKQNFGGNWDDKNIYYYAHNEFGDGTGKEGEFKTKYINFQKKLMHDLINGLKSLSNKKTHVIQIGSKYIETLKRGGCYLTSNKDNAQLFSKYRAIQAAKNYRDAEAIVLIKNTPKQPLIIQGSQVLLF